MTLQASIGPQGETGNTGPQGDVGPTGPAFPLAYTFSTQGIYHSLDTAGPTIGGTPWTSLTAAQRAVSNAAALKTWQDSSAFLRGTLTVDKQPTGGVPTYEFPPDVIIIPALRVLDCPMVTTLGAALKCVVGFTVQSDPQLTFSESAKTATRGAGSFLTDGFRINQYVTFTNTVSNNLSEALITNLTATVMTLGTSVLADEVVSGSTCTCVRGTRFVQPGGSPATIKNLTLDGGGTAASGSDALVDYLIHTGGTLSPNVAGSTMIVDGVTAKRARVAAIHGRNATLAIKNSSLSNFLAIGLWSEGCSECVLENSTIAGHAAAEYLILFEGSGAGASTRSGETMTNGGLWRCSKVVLAVGQVGVFWNGIGGGNFVDSTCEGSSVTSYKFYKSTGVNLRGCRSNAGNYAVFDTSISNSIQGFGVSTQKVYYLNNSRMCDANVQLESFSAFVDIEHLFGALEWVGYRRPNGSWVSKNNNSPTDGYWEKAVVVERLATTSGQPYFWKCSTNGNPNGGTGVFTAGPLVP